jgi:hypothetical protein
VRRFLIPVAFFAANAYSQAPPRRLPLRADVAWSQFGHDPQHTALSARPAQPLRTIHWQTPVDLSPPTSAQDYSVHYGSPVITADNTVIVPVKTGTYGGFEIEAFDGVTGELLYTLPTDYTLPPLAEGAWLLPYQPVLSGSRLYYPGAGGTIYYRDLNEDARDSNGSAAASGQMAFYGIDVYMSNQAALDGEVQISTPLTVDRWGDLFFGFIAAAGNPAGLSSGIARLAPDGTGTWVSAVSLTGFPSYNQLAFACAPALSNDQVTIYAVVALNIPEDPNEDSGYLVSLDATTLTAIADVALNGPQGGLASVYPESSATPMVGPDGDVYFGVSGNVDDPHDDRGWLLHFDSTLRQTKTPGSFGWDDTPSVVPASAVPSYTGTSLYLILTKYNDYAGLGTGDGVNKVAILDPNAQMQDEYSNFPVMVMQEVITVTGVTPDPTPGFPNAVKEWCLNSAAIDPFTKSAILNSEDGTAYRWDFTANTLSQSVPLGPGIGEAYTPTVIGPDGTAYAINDAILFAIGN